MKIPEKSPTSDGDEVKDVPIPLQTKLLGVWTVFSLPSSSNFRSKLPGAETFKKFHESLRSFPIIWRFLSDAMKIGPWLFPLYVGSNILGNTVSVLQLYNETVLLSMVQEATVANKPVARDEFIFAGSIYAFVVIAGWLVRTAKTRTSTVLENRLIHHFKAELLTAQSSLDLPTTENPEMKRKVENAIENAKGVWDTLKGLVDAASVTLGALGQISVLAQAFGSNLDVQLFLIVCVFRPWLSTTWWSGYMSFEYYAMVTDTRWLNMLTLFELGTDILYKKEVLGSNLDEYIKPAYQKYKAEIGDILISDPETQLMKSEPITYKDIDAVFNSLPLLVFAYRSMRSSGRLDLSKLMLMQRASDTVENFIYKAIDNTNTLKGALKSIYSLYEIIDAQPAMVDGDVNYPEEEFIERKGMSLEFRSVYFSYPQKSEAVLKDMSFTIQPGQLCVIVGENGCGKSTTVQLFTRLYDIVSGDILVDGRSLREFKLRDIRAAASVMYQDYKHLPLTVYENILIGNPDVSNPHEEVEKATKLGGAYDIVQKLPLKFETNLEPRNTGFSRAGWKTSNNKAFERFANEQKPTKLSGGEWQRLALSRSFMKNSEEVRLLCYDEPSASLDPKAEQEVFERLVNLRGEKTMVFITHRFGNLTKHADIILYMKEGHIIEQGTHTELLERGGEYAKMYNIQAEAFSEAK